MHPFRPPVVDRRVRFALAGCGQVAASHFEAIRRHAGRAEL
jgi:UDP-N-acetyl-2-amino-2-deoxyglucuronate dehydrogenase